jgi:hypothetical protein
VLLRDIASVKRLKQEDGPNLVTRGSAPHSFRLTSSRVTPTGLIIGHYEREGEVKTANVLVDPPSEREVARRKRMKREG